MAQAVEAEQRADLNPGETPPSSVIIIGAGPVGIRCAQEILKREPFATVTVFGNEPAQPYNRVKLSSLLAREVKYDDIITRLPDPDDHPGFRFIICTIQKIDTENNCVVDALGNSHFYQRLVIATGARPHRPNIPGMEQTGVYTFRNLKDTEYLFSRLNRAQHIVIVGGGLLGIEASRALLRFNTRVTLIQQGERLMNRQLDQRAAELLQKKIESLGVSIITNCGVREISGEGRVTGVVTRDKDVIACDTVLICAGIKPNMEMARDSRIRVGRGIVVDDCLQTSADNVYAIGECCEHAGQTYGLVAPGFEQAAICAELLCGGESRYLGSLEVSNLKVIGEAVCSMGEVADVHLGPRVMELTYRNKKKNLYRKIVTRRGKLIGMLAYGSWDETRRIQEAYQQGRTIWPWQKLWFYLTGDLFVGGGTTNVHQWPATTTVCQCNGITHGELVSAIAAGSTQLCQLQEETRAGTVCGSCKPLLEQLVGYSGPRDKIKAWLPTAVLSLLGLAIVTAILAVPGQVPSDSVQTIGVWESLWNDKFWKQVTGFSLLGMSVIGLLISVRKKLSWRWLGDFSYWRLLHIALGVAAATTLVLHTGMRLGENLNRALMIDFILVLSLGALAGGIVALNHKLSPASSNRVQKIWKWAHILVTWPLPALIGMHILTVYYF